jgi:exosortase
VTAFARVFLPLLLAYATALWWCWELWWLEDGYFGHQPLVPLVMAAVVWRRARDWRQRVAAPDLHAFWLLGPALLLHLAGAALTIDSLSAASLVLAVPGAAWLALGRERMRGLWPVVWLFAFAVPLPIYVTGQLAFELKENAVRGGVWLAQAWGIDVVRGGASLQVAGQAQALDVADPCSGLRSLLAMVTLVYCIAFFTGPASAWRRTLLLLAAAPVALLVNLLRIAAICWVAERWGVPVAAGTGHDVLNGVAWAVDLLLILGLDWWLSRRHAEGPATPLPVPTTPLRSPSGAPKWWLWACCAPLLWLSLYRPGGETAGRAAALPASAGEFVQQQEYAMSERWYHLLGTRDASWRHYVDSGGNAAFVVAVFHGSNWKSVHPPHVCLRASNMDELEDGALALGDGTDAQVGRILLRGRDDGRPYLCLFAYGARDLCTGSYLGFFLHHAPRALFRASNDGFLLRVECYADGQGGVAAAERRCRELLRALLASARGLLP